MGKNIIQQRRGKGSMRWRVPAKSFRPQVAYSPQEGTVVDIVTNPLMDAPLAQVKYADQHTGYIIASEGLKVGDTLAGRVLTLRDVKEGSQIFGLETSPFSGPKLCRAPGSFATLVSKTESSGLIQMPSKKTLTLNLDCRVTLGVPAGEGRAEKPYAKAGAKTKAMHARGKLYPITSGNRKNILDHPFGGSGHGKRRPPVSKHAPPGRKVGTVSSRRTGKKK